MLRLQLCIKKGKNDRNKYHAYRRSKRYAPAEAGEDGEREHYQTFGYLRATKFPIAILVNFGTERRAKLNAIISAKASYTYSKGLFEGKQSSIAYN